MVLKRKRSFKRTSSKSSAARMLRRRKMASYKAKKRIAYRMKRRLRKSFKGGPKKFHHKQVVAKRYINVSRDIRKEHGYYKLFASLQTPSRVHTTTDVSQLDIIGSYWISMGSMYNPYLTGCSTDISNLYVPPKGFVTDVVNKFRRTMVLCQKLTVTVDRLDTGNTGSDNWEVMITPVRPADLNDYGYLVIPGLTFPAGAGTPSKMDIYRSQSEWAGTKRRVLANGEAAYGSGAPRRCKVSSTVHMNSMILSPSWKTQTKTVQPVAADPYTKRTYEENNAATPIVVDALDRPYWNVSIYRKGPVNLGTSNTTWTVRFGYTWWVHAYDPKLPYTLTAPHDGESKEEKKEEPEMHDDEPPLENFHRLGVRSPTVIRSPSPAVSAGGPAPTRPLPLAPPPLLRR